MDAPRRDVGSPVNAQGAQAPLVSRSCRVPDVSLREFLVDEPAPRVHWTTPDGLEIAGRGAAASITADGDGRFDVVRERADALFATVDDGSGPEETRPRLFGGFAFHDDHESEPPWRGFESAGFVLPAEQLTRTGDETWLTVSAVGADPESVDDRLDELRSSVKALPLMRPTGKPPGVVETRRTTTREQWAQQVETAVDRIVRGELTKVVLAQALTAELAADICVPDVLEGLRSRYPDCYRFLVEPSEAAGFFGAPPERLVALSGRVVETEALAGSAARGDSLDQDEALAKELRESEKVQHEHRVVVDTICDQLAPLAKAVTVEAQTVRRLANIQHLQTPIRARLADDEHVLSVVEAVHPTPAVGGLPPDAALETIRETEAFDRGWYAAPVGWFDADGDGEFAVCLRSAVAGDRSATLFAGNGIVAESDPDEEWHEVELKYRPILDALEGD